ncbi:restriction endonuclease subunit S [Salinicola sp. LHM]|uniref:restriction endonuclease subunit S n=1 Tax=Salinicola sp. LHM TaxID=3065298 RepID=UPI002ACE0E86|nr:restriction endonuclease subunit S [Salinicola sp. LHM]WQH35077.1 restriction endonuclease subunit S [Salinicola sp. LHM]
METKRAIEITPKAKLHPLKNRSVPLTPLNPGPLPGDWEVHPIGSVSHKVTNGFVGSSLPHQLDEPGISYLQGFNIRPSRIDLTKRSYVTADFHRSNPKSCLKAGDILIVQSGHIGTAARVPDGFGAANCHALIIVDIDRDLVDPDYVVEYLNSALGQARLRGLHVGSSMLHINTSELADYQIPLPQLREQRKIAEIMRTWNEAIEKLDRLRTAYESRILGLRDSLMARASRQGRPACFGDFLTESRIPGSNGATARKISVRLYGKGTLEKNSSRSGSANTRYYRRKAGQIIWSKLDFLNGAFALIGPELDGCESTLDLPAFDCDPSVNQAWLIEYLTRPAYYTRQVHLARGQRKARRIAPDDWLASPLRLPDRATQDHIADTLSCARKELSLLDAEIDAVTRQKRGLMQKLLTGEWRVSPTSEEPSETLKENAHAE